MSKECSICYNINDDKGYAITSCNHIFCIDCVLQYNKKSCPMCRQTINEFKIAFDDLYKRTVEKIVEKKIYVDRIVEKRVEIIEEKPNNSIKEIFGENTLNSRKLIFNPEYNHMNEYEKILQERLIMDEQIKTRQQSEHETNLEKINKFLKFQK